MMTDVVRDSDAPMLTAEGLLVIAVDGANFGHALERLCNLAPLHRCMRMLPQCYLCISCQCSLSFIRMHSSLSILA